MKHHDRENFNHTILRYLGAGNYYEQTRLAYKAYVSLTVNLAE